MNNSRKRLSTADEEEPTSSTASKQPRQSVEDQYHNKSNAWKYFEFDYGKKPEVGDTATCTICRKTIACVWKSSTTGEPTLSDSRLKSHLKTAHNITVERVIYEQKDAVRCPFCGNKYHPDSLRWGKKTHFGSKNCKSAAFYSDDGWSNDFVAAMDGQEDFAQLTKYMANNETKEWTSVYVVRQINGKETPRALLYVGLTSQMEQRFDLHRQRGTFAEHDRVEKAILKSGMTKGAAEFLEATLILSSPPTNPLLNTNTEHRHLVNNIEDGPQFAEDVRHWHRMAVQMLWAQWSKLDWEEWRPLLAENEKEGTRKRGERSRSPLKAELKKENAELKKELAELKRAMAEKDAALSNSHESNRKWKNRAWNARKRAEQFSEAVNELDHSTWTELTKDDDENSDEFVDENNDEDEYMDENNDEDEYMDENNDDEDTLVFDDDIA